MSEPTTDQPLDIAVHDDPAHSRYQVTVDGAPAGGAYYQLKGNSVVFTHTEVDPSFGGKGVGSVLAKFALNDVRATGRRAVPVCPFIATYIKRHPDYLDLVDEPYATRLTTPPVG